MQVPDYDIFKKDAAALIWVEAVHDFETAKIRIKLLAALTGSEHLVFDQRSRRIVAETKSQNRFASDSSFARG